MNGKQHMNYKQKAARARIKKIMIATGLVVGVSATGVTDIIQPFTKHMTTTVHASEITDFTYKVVNGTVTITGYNGGSVVTIPAEIDGLPVTSIGDSAFENKSLTEVHFEGNNLTHIGDNAFRSTGIKNVIIPEGVETIGLGAFYGNQINQVVIPASVTNVGYYSFGYNNMANAYFAGDKTSISVAFPGNPGIIINAPDPSKAKQYAEENGYQYMPWTAPKSEPETPSNPGEDGSSTGSNSGDTGSNSGTADSNTGSNSGDTGSNSGTADSNTGSNSGDTGSNSGTADSNTGNATNDSYVQKNDLSANITSGGLFLGNIDITNFGDIAVTDKAKTYFTSINNPLNVKDLRGNQEGWELSVSATAMAGENHALPKGSLTLDGVDTITSESSSAENMPAKKLVDRTIIDDGNVLVAKAEKGTGAGTFDIAFKENAIGLTIDPQTAKTGEYHSTITWTLASTPTSSTN